MEGFGANVLTCGDSPPCACAHSRESWRHDVATIADQGGWARNSAALHRYIRIVDQWTDNPLAGIGL